MNNILIYVGPVVRVNHLSNPRQVPDFLLLQLQSSIENTVVELLVKNKLVHADSILEENFLKQSIVALFVQHINTCTVGLGKPMLRVLKPAVNLFSGMQVGDLR